MKRSWLVSLRTAVRPQCLFGRAILAAAACRCAKPRSIRSIGRIGAGRNTTASAARRACPTRSTPTAGATAATCSGRKTELGGRSTPIVLRGKLYTILRADPATPKEGEQVVCVDAATGKTFGNRGTTSGRATCPIRASAGRASSAIRRRATSMPSARAACSSATTATPARSSGRFRCTSRFGLLSTYGGRTNFPVVFEDLVILGSVDHRLGRHGGAGPPLHGLRQGDRPGRLVRQHAAAPAGHDLLRPGAGDDQRPEAADQPARAMAGSMPCSRGPARSSGNISSRGAA